ncbi:hypothetical protein ACQEUU_00400 [Nonomuraea sp. CA-218870]
MLVDFPSDPVAGHGTEAGVRGNAHQLVGNMRIYGAFPQIVDGGGENVNT